MGGVNNAARSTEPPVRQQAAFMTPQTCIDQTLSIFPDIKPKHHSSVHLLMLWIPVLHSGEEATDRDQTATECWKHS